MNPWCNAMSGSSVILHGHATLPKPQLSSTEVPFTEAANGQINVDKKVEINKRQDGEGKRTQNWGAVDLGLTSNSLSH